MILFAVRDNKSGRGQNRPDQYVFLLMVLLHCGAFLSEPHELMKYSQCFYDSDQDSFLHPKCSTVNSSGLRLQSSVIQNICRTSDNLTVSSSSLVNLTLNPVGGLGCCSAETCSKYHDLKVDAD